MNTDSSHTQNTPSYPLRSRWTLRKAILLFCISSVLFALILQTLLFRRTLRDQIRQENISENQASMEKMQADLSGFIHDIRTEMLTIYNENDIIEALRQKAAGKDVDFTPYYWRTWYLARRRFSSDDQLEAMYLYDNSDFLISAYRYNVSTLPRDIYKADFDTNADRVYKYVHEEESRLLVTGYNNPAEEKDLVRFVLKLHNYDEERQQIGYLVCDVDSRALTSIMDRYATSRDVYLWLQPLYDRTIARTGRASEEQVRIQKQLSRVVENYYDTQTLEEEYDDFYLIQMGQNAYDVEAFALVPQSLLTAALSSLFRTLLIIMAGMSALTIAVVWIFSRWLTKPVEEMRDSIVRIKNGETDLRVRPVGWSEELEVLGNEFNEMLDRIQSMVKEEYEYRLLVERTEYKMLQAQINPHFLYNTLDTMSGIANAQDCTLVSGLCQSLSAIFRYCLDMTDELSTMQKEMAHTRNYLYVMDVRNGSSIEYEYQIDSDTMQDRLPRICLQPIVENAINHGLRNVRRKDKKLLIRSEHVDGNLVITVQDNGTGMDAEAMNRELAANDPKRVESGISIGILNVNARLKKLFGDDYGIHIDSTEGEGTTVTVTVPVITEEEHEQQ